MDNIKEDNSSKNKTENQFDNIVNGKKENETEDIKQSDSAFNQNQINLKLRSLNEQWSFIKNLLDNNIFDFFGKYYFLYNYYFQYSNL